MQKMASVDKEYTEEQYRLVIKHCNRKLRNPHVVCPDKKSYELILIRRATDTKRKFFQCKYCGRVATNYSNLNKHCRIHVGDKRYKCCLCGEAFTDSSVRNRHCLAHNSKYFWYHNNCVTPCCDRWIPKTDGSRDVKDGGS